ncbi:MAG: response regulator [Thermoproteota archaeon]|nr:response regulator [Thermoproteota archaeon]
MKGNDGSISILDLAKEISFLDRSMSCCIGFVDIVDSTKATAEMMVSNRPKIRQYYSIFINTMAILAKNYGAKIIKNAGDALIFYFPDSSSDPTNEPVFKDILECFTTMILAHDIINSKLHSENLPSVSYRISADYGRVEVATSTSSKSEDLFGSTMNICAKINSMAEPNGIVIGGDLYQIIKSFSFIDKYEFRELEGYSTGFGNSYPLYAAALSDNTRGIDINRINQLFSSDQTPSIKDVRAKQQSQQQQQRYSTNIMIVDDEPDTLFTYEWFLSDEGYNVEGFTDPQEALKRFVQLSGAFSSSSYYQLVLLDIRMPRLNGLQLFNTIKTLSPDTKIMFCSALDVAEELVSILPDIEHDCIIRKPVERQYFISKINSALNN